MMLKLVVHNPIVSDKFIRDALADLEMATTMSRYGIFFLLNVDWDKRVIDKLEKKDTREVALACDADRASRVRRRIQFIGPIAAPDQYPLGATPTWGVVSESIQVDPSVLMSSFHFDERFTVDPWASRFFVAMTRQVLGYLDTERLDLLANAPSLPGTLEAAMECWTVKYIKELFVEVSWVALSVGLAGAGKAGRQKEDFEAMFRHFFPTPDVQIPRRSPWYPFSLHGYLDSYHKHIEMWGADSAIVGKTDDALKLIFKNLQCLPNHTAATSSAPGKLWIQSDRGFGEILTNPCFYKILGLVRQPRTTKNASRLKLSMSKFLVMLHKESTGIPEEVYLKQQKRKAAYNRNQKLSAKARNYRAPRRCFFKAWMLFYHSICLRSKKEPVVSQKSG